MEKWGIARARFDQLKKAPLYRPRGRKLLIPKSIVRSYDGQGPALHWRKVTSVTGIGRKETVR
jgi:hypothetical protein